MCSSLFYKCPGVQMSVFQLPVIRMSGCTAVRFYMCSLYNCPLYKCPVIQMSDCTFVRCTNDFMSTVGCCTGVRCTVMRAPFHESAHWKRSKTWRLHLKMLLMFPWDKSTNFCRYIQSVCLYSHAWFIAIMYGPWIFILNKKNVENCIRCYKFLFSETVRSDLVSPEINAVIVVHFIVPALYPRKSQV